MTKPTADQGEGLGVKKDEGYGLGRPAIAPAPKL